ncbi:sensor histidine kinase [Catalinimonas niigatensis]|uniref:sensor histidine kinase n=1 Tax=Catalinimonas niigatensis TaxID=1397264 RepID=UPI002665C34A|nr:histidine kinase [Catalinimonas niigatensis]WPP52646.1 histidine kinase [Catalinimonas niigatensis]
MSTHINSPLTLRLVMIHIGGWVAFVLLLFVIFGTPINDLSVTMRTLLSTIPLIILFYSNTSFLIPRLLAKKKVIPYILAVIGAVGLVALCTLWIERTFNGEFYRSRDWYPGIVTSRAVLNSLLILTVSGGLKMTKEWFRNERLKNEMEKEKMASELAMLKSQINPHFLFNNLNNIYSLAIKKSEDAPKGIVMLSEMMRYVLYDSSADKISLSKEVEHLQNYIDLQKLRLKQGKKICFDTEGELEIKKIEPMLLEPFVENAFKHGDIFRQEGNICIKLKVEGDELSFTVKNTVSRNGHVKDQQSGIGLKNIEKRLDLLYPGRHQLHIQEKEGTFEVDLKLNLTYD